MVLNLILGQKTLVTLHKHMHMFNGIISFNMSFYLSLSSRGSKDVFSNNHGGDFQTLLNHPLDLQTDAWEVALAEMTYSGQTFPNIQPEETLVTLRYNGRPPFNKDYVISYEQSLKLSVTFGLYAVDCESPLTYTKIREVHIQFPPQNYTWLNFTDMFTEMYLNKFGNSITISANRFKFVESHKEFKPYLHVKFSPYFVYLFHIDTHEYSSTLPTDRHDIGFIVPPTLKEKDGDMIVMSPYIKGGDVYIEVDGMRVFYMKRQYWTYYLFKDALKAWSQNQTDQSWLSSITLEADVVNGKWEYKLIFVANPLKKGGQFGNDHIIVIISDGFSSMYFPKYASFRVNEVKFDTPCY